MKKTLVLLLFIVIVLPLCAQTSEVDKIVNNIFNPLISFLDKVLFFDLFAAVGLNLGVKVPFIVLWLIAGSLS